MEWEPPPCPYEDESTLSVFLGWLPGLVTVLAFVGFGFGIQALPRAVLIVLGVAATWVALRAARRPRVPWRELALEGLYRPERGRPRGRLRIGERVVHVFLPARSEPNVVLALPLDLGLRCTLLRLDHGLDTGGFRALTPYTDWAQRTFDQAFPQELCRELFRQELGAHAIQLEEGRLLVYLPGMTRLGEGLVATRAARERLQQRVQRGAELAVRLADALALLVPLDPSRVRAARLDCAREVCPYCKDALAPEVSREVCPRCSAAHHADCWRDAGGCTVFACAPPRELERERDP